MDITCTKAQLATLLELPASIANSRASLPILGHLLLVAGENGLTVTGTDLEQEVSHRGPLTRLTAPGSRAVPARKLADIVRALPDGSDIRLHTTAERCILTAGRGRYILGALPAEDFPSSKPLVEPQSFCLPRTTLQTLIAKTAFAMAKDDVRYYLQGLSWELQRNGCRMIGCDGHRLAILQHPLDEPAPDNARSVIAPYAAVRLFQRALKGMDDTLQVQMTDTLLRITAGDLCLATRLVDATYPDVERVMPATLDQSATGDRLALLGALQRIRTLSNEQYRGVIFSFAPGTLTLDARNADQEQSQEAIDLQYDGPPVAIGWQLDYVIETLQAITTEAMVIGFTDGNSNSLWRGLEALQETYCIMPMRL